MSYSKSSTPGRRAVTALLLPVMLVLLSKSVTTTAVTTDEDGLALVEAHGGGVRVPCDETVAGGDFVEIFDCGDELFEARFNAVDGVGIDVGDGGRFARGPRPDLLAWNSNTPRRETGPNGESCLLCHFDGADAGDGSGPVVAQHMRDPLAAIDAVGTLPAPGRFIQRSAPHLFGAAGLQLLAEEMTADLHAARDDARAQACDDGAAVTVALETKGVGFGAVTMDCDGVVDATALEGIDPDLVVKPFEWKGVERTIRSFSRGAFHNELGMQPVETTGDGVDGDHDGVADEISIADVTAMAVYIAAQPRPTSLRELDRLRRWLERQGSRGRQIAGELGLPALTRTEIGSIERGEAAFERIGCADCHRPSLATRGVVFSEPSQVASYRDDPLPAGQDPVARGLDPQRAVTFDITADQPDNVFEVVARDRRGGLRVQRRHLGSFERDPAGGGALVRLYGDLKRHDMGERLAESIDAPPCECGASVWMTKELWGVASTAPYLHDGRATTLTEAVLEHGGEAGAARAAFVALPGGERDDLLSFLDNLVLFFPAEDE